jgi:hypothetical protein
MKFGQLKPYCRLVKLKRLYKVQILNHLKQLNKIQVNNLPINLMYMKTNFVLTALLALTILSSCSVGNAGDKPKVAKIGDVLTTDMFQITVNKETVADQINTGSELADLPKEAGTVYLILNVTYKNIDKESRMLFDGDLLIDNNGQEYKYDKSEMIMAKGWGLNLEAINPLTSITTNIVYKIPADVKGKFYWHPGRTDSDEKIDLGITN